MTWLKTQQEQAEKGQLSEVLTKEEFFTSFDNLKFGGHLKTGVFGPPGIGKSMFAMSFPPPIYFFDTENAIDRLKASFVKMYPAGKKVHFVNIYKTKPGSIQQDGTACLETLVNGLKLLENETEGTVVIDSMSDIWEWLQSWGLEYVEREKKRAWQMFDWKYPKDKSKSILYFLKHLKMNVCLTAKDKEEYAGAGAPLDATSPKWEKDTSFQLDIVVNLGKVPDTMPQLGYGQAALQSQKWRYYGDITKCKNWRLSTNRIEGITYDKVIELLKNEGAI